MWRRKPERGMDLQRHPHPPHEAPVPRGHLGQRVALAWPERTEAKKRWRKSLRRGTWDLALSSLLALEVFFLPGFVFLPLSPYHLPRVGVQRKNHQAKPLPAPRPTSTSPHCKTYSEASEIILDPAKWSPSYSLTAKSARRPPQLARWQFFLLGQKWDATSQLRHLAGPALPRSLACWALLLPGLLSARRCPSAIALDRVFRNIWDLNKENIEAPRLSSAQKINSLHSYTL